MNFGTIKNIYAKFLINSYINESSKDDNKKRYKKFITTIAESPILRTQFIVYKNIENGHFSSEVSAVEYIKENISLFERFNKKEIIRENKNLLNKLRFSYGKVKLNDTKEIHEALNNLITLEKEAETINKIHESFEIVKKWLITPKEKISENTTKSKVDPKNFLNIVTKKYNEKYSNISEEEKKILKVIWSKNDGEKESLLKDMIKESITLLNYNIKQFGNSIEVKEKLLEAKDVIYNLEYNKETFKEDILKVYNLKINLS